MASAFFSRSKSAVGQIKRSKPSSTWLVGVFVLLALAAMLATGCSSSIPQSESEVGSTELEVVETLSTSSTVPSEVGPIDVRTTVGGQDARPPSAAAQPEQASAQDSQPRVTSAPTTQYIPPTTQYVCVPDGAALSALEGDYRRDKYLYDLAYSDLIRRGAVSSGAAVELQNTRSRNAAEYERARSAINSCQGAYWYFMSY